MDEIRKALTEDLVVPLWPIAGKALGLKRGATYSGAAKGDIPTINVGKLKKVSTAWLRRKVGLEESA